MSNYTERIVPTVQKRNNMFRIALAEDYFNE